jgi:predicted porin
MSVNAYMLGADWKISGPHGLRGNWTHANSTSGSFGNIVGAGAGPLFRVGTCAPTLVGNRVANCGNGNTGADLYQIQYYYTFSKRTEASVGYVYLDNASQARYSLGGLASNPAGGAQQNAVAVTVRHTF